MPGGVDGHEGLVVRPAVDVDDEVAVGARGNPVAAAVSAQVEQCPLEPRLRVADAVHRVGVDDRPDRDRRALAVERFDHRADNGAVPRSGELQVAAVEGQHVAAGDPHRAAGLKSLDGRPLAAEPVPKREPRHVALLHRTAQLWLVRPVQEHPRGGCAVPIAKGNGSAM